MFCGCQRGRDCQTCAVYGCLTDRHTRLRALARQDARACYPGPGSTGHSIPEGDHDQRDIVTAKFFYRSSTATVWTFSASSTVCKFIKSTYARTSLSTEVFTVGIYTTFPPTSTVLSLSSRQTQQVLQNACYLLLCLENHV